MKQHAYIGLESMRIGQWKIGWRWYGPMKVPLYWGGNHDDDDVFEKKVKHIYEDIVMELWSQERFQ